jgi:hypothetical protein
VFIDDFASTGVHIQLSRLLLESHAMDQVVDASLDGRSRLFVQGRSVRLRMNWGRISRDVEARGAAEE